MLVELPDFVTSPIETKKSRHIPTDHGLFHTQGDFWICFIGIEGRAWGRGPNLCCANEAAAAAFLKLAGHSLIRGEIRITPDGSFWFCGSQELEDFCSGDRLCDDLLEAVDAGGK